MSGRLLLYLSVRFTFYIFCFRVQQVAGNNVHSRRRHSHLKPQLRYRFVWTTTGCEFRLNRFDEWVAQSLADSTYDLRPSFLATPSDAACVRLSRREGIVGRGRSSGLPPLSQRSRFAVALEVSTAIQNLTFYATNHEIYSYSYRQRNALDCHDIIISFPL